ncbi:JmjC domain-containing protein 4 [Chionoecetes opilio]|uniref:JmjC domain-containing protein 4 n=1 Tax=Chionoecetes opilio TaxID=41210 RepID=A0A8J4XUS6_CHIOP|nr:JmjC domain-containing protein 4 [Chionoecetes opilio]
MIELSSSECSPCHHATAPLSAFPRISDPLDYDEFLREYLEKNKPCVFSARFTEGWRARQAWVTQAGTPDVDYLLHHFDRDDQPPFPVRRNGEAKVPVADCDQKHYDSQEKKTYTLQEYIQYWNTARESSEGKKLCLYLKNCGKGVAMIEEFPSLKFKSSHSQLMSNE